MKRTLRSDGRAGGQAGCRAGGQWTLLIDRVGRSGAENMATDEALLDEVARNGGAFLRVYRWDPPTLSIGRNQSVDNLATRGIPVVRRPTGGNAVWHEHEVTYAVAAPIAMFGSLRVAYREIHTRLATALHSLGVDAVLAPARPPARPSAPSCFAAPAGGEILVRGRKLVGSAQVRRGNAFLQHGSILIDGTQPASLNGETTLTEVLGRPVTFEQVASAIIARWPEPLEQPPASPPARPPAPIASLAAQ